MSPAGATVLGNVLVADVCKEVGSVNVVPDPLFGEVNVLKDGVNLPLNGFSDGDTAWVLFVDESFSGESDTDESRYSEGFHEIFIFNTLLLTRENKHSNQDRLAG